MLGDLRKLQNVKMDSAASGASAFLKRKGTAHQSAIEGVSSCLLPTLGPPKDSCAFWSGKGPNLVGDAFPLHTQ